MSSIYKDKKLDYEEYEIFTQPESFNWENCDSDNQNNILTNNNQHDKEDSIKKENIQLFFDQKINKNNDINYDD